MTDEQKKKAEWLSGYIDLCLDIEIERENIIKLRSRAEKVTSAMSPAPGGGQGADFTVSVDDLVCRIDELEDKVKYSVKVQKKIEKAIDAVKSPLHRRVLKRKYINGDSFVVIAKKEGKSYKHIVLTVHPQALDFVKIGTHPY